MLRKIRRVLALIFFIAITLLFLDFTGAIHIWFGWMAKVQFLPAILALNLIVIVALLLLTLICGRIYCSVICPLGVMQDIIAWFGKKSKKNRYTYSKPKKWLRWGIVLCFVLALIFGISAFVAILAPYSSYGRIASNLFSPIYLLVNNLFANISERVGGYGFYHKEVVIGSIITFAIAAVMFAILFILSWRNGRTYCNTICPVGTILGVFARYSLFRPIIDKDKCIKCNLCSKNCKASCIDINGGYSIDYSRCVTCGDCIEKCNKGALKYRFAYACGDSSKSDPARNSAEIDKGRRNVLTVGVTLATAATLKAQEKITDGGLAPIIDKESPMRGTQIVPPGAKGLKNMSSHCTACQLCISVCPNGVLSPSENLETLMQPRSSYHKGYCRPECTKCSEVCPTGAIVKINQEEKSSIQIGHAVWDGGLCLPMISGVHCGNCAKHCPAGAIQMVEVDPTDEKSPKFPVVDEEKCIGCGACEYVCPSSPQSAIYVEGHEVHRVI